MSTPGFHLEILTPERAFFLGEVQSIIIPTPTGQMGILRGHLPMVTSLEIGMIRIQQDDEWKEAFVSEGFADIHNEEVFLFAQAAEWPEEIDIRRAEIAEMRAKERLMRRLSQQEYAWSTTALARARVRMRVGSHRPFEE